MDYRFVILDLDPVVSLDVRGALISEFPAADITVAESLPHIKVSADAPRTVAILPGKLEINTPDTITNEILAQGGGIVWIGEQKTDRSGFVYLPKPFSQEMLVNAINRIIHRGNGTK